MKMECFLTSRQIEVEAAHETYKTPTTFLSLAANHKHQID
jgi:hypothetical protein